MNTRAAVLREVGGPLTLETLVLDEPRPDEVIVRLTSTGICHTDIGFQRGFLPVPVPFVLGHEGAGVVERLGTGVTRLAVGDHVVLSFDTCGQCVTCRSGHPSYCLEFAARNISGGRPDGSPTMQDEAGDVVHAGFFAQSSFATHALATERSVVKVDETPTSPSSARSAAGCRPARARCSTDCGLPWGAALPSSAPAAWDLRR